jgi:4'-phosphopantetheinyl transferase
VDRLVMSRPRAQLPADELHVWRASLERPDAAVAAYEALLSGDERQRAGEFRFERDRTSYVVARGVLRTLLGRYLGARPQDLAFRYGEFGKPRLDGAGPRFNLSHAGSVGLFAFGAAVEVGVDVEVLGEHADRQRIAERFFSADEARRLGALPAGEQDAGFLACWTRKEAFVKARGDGLSLALDAFDVGFGAQSPCALLRTAWSRSEPERWQITDLTDQAAGYVGAVAARGRGLAVVLRDFADLAMQEQSPSLQEMT